MTLSQTKAEEEDFCYCTVGMRTSQGYTALVFSDKHSLLLWTSCRGSQLVIRTVIVENRLRVKTSMWLKVLTLTIVSIPVHIRAIPTRCLQSLFSPGQCLDGSLYLCIFYVSIACFLYLHLPGYQTPFKTF
jgi:hypothetical protein